MKLIETFHNMEIQYSLFDIKGEHPYWDILRYSVFINYYYTDSAREYLGKSIRHSAKEYIGLIYKILLILKHLFFFKYEHVALTASRTYSQIGRYYYDTSALPFFKRCKKIIAVESIIDKKTPYPTLFDFSNILLRFSKRGQLPITVYRTISIALIESFGECKISYKDLDIVYRSYLSEIKYYTFLLHYIKPKNVIIFKGNPKGIIYVCKKNGIPTSLIQHAGIEKDEIDYSYPEGVTMNSNILFPKVIGTFGPYWCKGLNTPSIIIPIGNDEKFFIPNLKADNSILVISTIVHGTELKIVTKKLANELPHKRFVYKLHPNEFFMKNEYKKYFGDFANVSVVSIEDSIQNYIARSFIVLAIVSAAVYEALHQGKLVAIYKKINYERQGVILSSPNVLLFTESSEFVNFCSTKPQTLSNFFYAPENEELYNQIINLS